MQSHLDTLTILAEVTIAFVAFAAITATLRRTLGEQLGSFQKLLIRWFTETGMITVSIELLPLVLAGFWQDEPTVARISILYALASCVTYFVYYLRRRRRTEAAMPIASLLIMIGTAAWFVVLAMSAVGVLIAPSLAVLVAFCYWLLLSASTVFVTFLATFIFDEDSHA